MEFKDLIKLRRKINRLTQKQLAEKLNVSDKSVSNWEQGRNMPDLGLMIELCKVLSIHPYELLSSLDENIDWEDITYQNVMLVYKQKNYIEALKSILEKNGIEIPKPDEF